MLDAYVGGTIDKLYLVSNDFVNTMTQSPTVEQLPLKQMRKNSMRTIGITFTSLMRVSCSMGFWRVISKRWFIRRLSKTALVSKRRG